jgi:AraC family transcriptional regulator
MERLVQQETDLAALALDLGFASHSHFSDAFRRAFGVAPSECRRRASSSWLCERSKNLEAGEIARA